MKNLIILIFLIFAQPLYATETDDFIAHTEFVMSKVLCETNVVSDMTAAYKTYDEAVKKEPLKEKELTAEFSKNLRNAWVAQKFDITKYPKVTHLIVSIMGATMEIKMEFADLWAKAAFKQCPNITGNYRDTTSATMSIIASVGTIYGN